ncbi:OLC1v1008369C1 [Oldenlandia corymbosa var. corymbosa]|uniref:OLC1v1008369C1 n=1 Tax=Oldenlandia corymbosa var. corymbosa TaxID=529605 RepID=A0AAV1DLE7_OLDCO|nr:OLC1v1008369C1 [Oldenlandia corymbosa var. corymbosa]
MPPFAAESEAPPSNNLWIGNLTPEVTESDLMALFDKHGPIDSITNYSARSYAFVYFKKIDDAKAAKEQLQGTNLHGNSIKIEFAKPAKPCKSLWVAGLSQSISKEELEEEFMKFGKIQEFKFLRDRNTAYVDYFRLEDAAQALKNMNGKRLGGEQIRVDFLRSQPSRREPLPDFRDAREGQFPSRSIGPPDARWMTHGSMNPYSEPIHAGSKRHLPSSGGRRGDGQPSKVLWISYPPSVQIDEDMLHRAMILHGEIERIKTFEDRNYAFVQFRSVDEARLAKEKLQGKLFGNPRISIEYSNSELAPNSDYFGSVPVTDGPRPDVYMNDLPFRHGQMEVIGHNSQNLLPRGVPGADGLLRPLGSQDGHLGGPNWRRSSPGPGLLSSPSGGRNPSNRSASGVWDIFDASQLQRESKRTRVDDQGVGFDESYRLRAGSADARSGYEGRNRVSPINAPAKRLSDPGYVWRGVLARGGSPVCRARCVPVGKGIEFEIPNIVNCTARTGLDMLTKHFAEAVDFSIAYFSPDSEDDFASYTQFLKYLEDRNRAGVAKFDDGTTLFLVPPSEFLTKVLRVDGPPRLYGVVLEFPPAAPDTTSQSVSLQQHYLDQQNHTGSSLAAYNGMPPEGMSVPMQFTRTGHEDTKPPLKVLGPSTTSSTSINNAAVSQAGVAITPELIATLSSLFPANIMSGSGNSSVQTTSILGPTLISNPTPDKGIAPVWPLERNVPEQTVLPMPQFSSQGNFLPQVQAYTPVSNPANFSAQGGGYNQIQDAGFNVQQQGVVHSRPVGPSHVQVSAPIHVGPQHSLGMHQESVRGHGMAQDTSSLRFYGSSIPQQPANLVTLGNEVNSTIAQQPHAPLLHASGVNVNNQLQERPAEDKTETEDEKNRRYQSTLLFAVNLLSKVKQPSGAQTSQGSANH